MSMTLEQLRAVNPDIRLYSIYDKEFEKYGRIIDVPEKDIEELAEAFEKTPIPAQGNVYVAGDEMLEQVPVVKKLARRVFGCMDIEAGYCNGNSYTLNALEYHKCSEVNFTTTGAVLLMGLQENIHDYKLDSADVVGFYVPTNVIIEVFPGTLHFAPSRIDEGGFRVLVILEKGTNFALDSTDPNAPGEERMLWMKNKWLICHPDSPQAVKGAFVGIYGTNLQLKMK